jgi:hypothetical protein
VDSEVVLKRPQIIAQTLVDIMRNFYYTFLVLLIFGCSKVNKESFNSRTDTIIFENDKPNTFIDKVGNFSIIKMNNEPLSRLSEDTITQIKITTGKIADLKLKLIPITSNIKIKKTDLDSNFFEIKSNKLAIDQESELAKFYVMQDTTYKKIVFIKRIYNDSNRTHWQDNIMNWADTLFSFQLSIKK